MEHGNGINGFFASPLIDTTFYYDTLSSYDVQSDRADTIEIMAVSETETDQIFHIDFKK